MIIVENWSGTSNSFTLDLAPPPAAQTGPPDPTVVPVGNLCDNDPAIQLGSVTVGGTWSGNGVSSSGNFNPSTAGIGSHVITYTIGQPPCQAQDQMTIDVINCNPCSMDNLSAAVNNCNVDVSGVLSFNTPPLTGQLIVEDCFGNQETFNPPFISPTYA